MQPFSETRTIRQPHKDLKNIEHFESKQTATIVLLKLTEIRRV